MNIKSSFLVNGTMVSNHFIDEYMALANGEYIKEYLFLIRHEGEEVSVSMIADALNHTEADVMRALTYWKKAGVLNEVAVSKPETTFAAASETACSVKPAEERKKETTREGRKSYTPEQINGLAGDEDFSQLLYIAQKYLNKVFTQRDCEVFAYLYDGIHMPVELLEYVVEYCVQGGHTSLRYIETVAISWHEKGFKTVDNAKNYALTFSKDSFAVMRAFGLSDRNPGDLERDYMDKWFRTFGFSKELVIEACNRTLAATHSPSFPYADKILQGWKKAGVRTMEEIRKLDEQHADKKKNGDGKGSKTAAVRKVQITDPQAQKEKAARISFRTFRKERLIMMPLF